MKKAILITAITIMLLSANQIQGGVSIVQNSSFEDDGNSIGDITAQVPLHWGDVNLPTGKFTGYVGDYWTTHGDYALTIRVESQSTQQGDMATVSQQVYLEDVNEIIFDLKLSSAMSFVPWDSNTRSAVVMIDGNDVWDSNDFTPNGEGEYRNQIINISEVNDSNLHTLTLAIRTNVNDEPIIEYYADWDFIKFDVYCGGFGHLWEDLNLDCYVNFGDYAILANRWLEEDPNNDKYDLLEDGVIDEGDIMVLSDAWLDCTDWRDANCPAMELLTGDVDESGRVNYGDIFEITDNWLSEEESRADINDDGIVNFLDFAIVADEWLLEHWLGYLDYLKQRKQ